MEIEQAAKRMPDPATCTHIRLCGNSSILARWPAFYTTHEQPGDGQEWQVCRLCNDERLVQALTPIGARVPQRVVIVPPVMGQVVLERHYFPDNASAALPVIDFVAPATAVAPLLPAYVDPYEIGAIVNEIVAIDRDLQRATAEIEARDWESWDNIISAAEDASHARHERAVKLVEQVAGIPAMLDEWDEEESLPDLPPDHHVSVELPSGFIAHVDPAVIGTAEGEDLFALLDRVGEAVVEQFGAEGGDVEMPGAELQTEPLLYSQAITLDMLRELDDMEGLIDELRLHHMEQTELIVELRDKLRTIEQRAQEVIEADQAGWKVRLAESEERNQKLQEQLALAERVIYVGWGIAKGIAADARAVVARLEGYGR